MRRFWIRYDVKFGGQTHGVLLGCGVTAETRDAALRMAEALVFRGAPVPAIRAVTEDVDLSSLDQRHIIPNIGDPSRAGVWFPALQAKIPRT